MRGFVKIMARRQRRDRRHHRRRPCRRAAGAGDASRSAASCACRDLANQTYAYPTLAEAIRFAAEQRGQASLFTPTVRKLIAQLFQKLP